MNESVTLMGWLADHLSRISVGTWGCLLPAQLLGQSQGVAGQRLLPLLVVGVLVRTLLLVRRLELPVEDLDGALQDGIDPLLLQRLDELEPGG